MGDQPWWVSSSGYTLDGAKGVVYLLHIGRNVPTAEVVREVNAAALVTNRNTVYGYIRQMKARGLLREVDELKGPGPPKVCIANPERFYKYVEMVRARLTSDGPAGFKRVQDDFVVKLRSLISSSGNLLSYLDFPAFLKQEVVDDSGSYLHALRRGDGDREPKGPKRRARTGRGIHESLPSKVSSTHWNEMVFYFLEFLYLSVFGCWVASAVLEYDFAKFDRAWDANEREEGGTQTLYFATRRIEEHLRELDDRKREEAKQAIRRVALRAEFPLNKPGLFFMELNSTHLATVNLGVARDHYSYAWSEGAQLASGQYRPMPGINGWSSEEDVKNRILRDLDRGILP